jgi:hypothetical protein
MRHVRIGPSSSETQAPPASSVRRFTWRLVLPLQPDESNATHASL